MTHIDLGEMVLGEDVPSRQRQMAAFLAWLVPGAGHLYLGRRFKGLAYTLIIHVMFMSGWVMSRGEAMSLHPEDGHRYAFFAQVGAGGPVALSLLITHKDDFIEGFDDETQTRLKNQRDAFYRTPEYVERLPWTETGLLYTMIAGLLNIMIVFEAFTGGQGIVPDRNKEQQPEAEQQPQKQPGPDPG